MSDVEALRRAIILGTSVILGAALEAGAEGVPEPALRRSLTSQQDLSEKSYRSILKSLTEADCIRRGDDGVVYLTDSGKIQEKRLRVALDAKAKEAAAAAVSATETTNTKKGATNVSTSTKTKAAANAGAKTVKDQLIEAVLRFPEKFRLKDPRGITVRISAAKSTVDPATGEGIFCLEDKGGLIVKPKISEARLRKVLIRLKDSKEGGSVTTMAATEKKAKAAEGAPPKGGLKRVAIFASYKGKTIEAFLVEQTKVEDKKGKVLGSPSAAASHFTGGQSINGWKWWKYIDAEGSRHEIGEIRSKPAVVRPRAEEKPAAEPAKIAKKKKVAKAAK